MQKGWQTKKLGDVCAFLNRGLSPAYLEQGGIRVLNQKCIRNHAVGFELSRRHDPKSKKVSEDRLIRAGDVLVNSTGTGTLGRVAQVRSEPDEATTVDSHITIVRPRPGQFYVSFFGYMLVAIEDLIKEAGEGCGGQTELTRSVLADRFSVSYPESLAEQQRIVALLDEAFAGLATAQAHAERNLRNARALFESHLNAVFTQRGEGWVERKLGEICIVDWGNTDLTKKSYVEGGAFLAVSAAGCDGRIGHKEHSKHTPVLSAIGAQCGRMFLPDEDFTAIKNTITLTPREGLCTGRFLYRLLTHVELPKRGAAQPFIAKGDIQAFSVSMPESLSAQTEIEAALAGLHAETHRLTRLYEQKLAALAALKQSFLHQAFSGAL